VDIHIETLSDFGEVVHKARKSASLRQVDAAHLIGVSPPVLNKLEQGKEVWLSKAINICNALGIEIVLRLPDSGEDK
jgi:transcriptional regulator with XRE-family HTH domain